MEFHILGWGRSPEIDGRDMTWVTRHEFGGEHETAADALRHWWNSEYLRHLRDPNRLYIVVPVIMANTRDGMGVFRMVDDEPIEIHHS